MFVEWIIGKFNPGVKDRSSLAIVNWAFRVVLFLAGTKVTFIGLENVPTDTPVLYVGNHRSFFDVVITYTCNRLHCQERDREGSTASQLDAQPALPFP
mgnify:CR=1 FL=1